MYVDAAPIFQKLGCELSVVSTAKLLGEYASSFEKAGYKVYHMPYSNSKFSFITKWKNNLQLIYFLKSEHYDVVHTHRSDMKWDMALCAWIAGCKSIYTFHSVFKSNWYSYRLHRWLRWSAKHLFGCTFQTISDSVYENEKQYYHNDTIKIYNWYGSNRFYPAEENEKEKVRKELKISKDTLVLISVGGCSPIKRHTDILKALPKILEEKPDTIYFHLGEGTSLKEEMELAKQLNIVDKIHFYGNQTDIRKYLIASDIYLMTSKNEGIPLTTIEAMACRIPTILYNVPGLKDFNKREECSVLIEADYNLLANMVLSFSKDKEKQKLITDKAERLVKSNFSMEKNVIQIFDLYKK